MEVIQVAAFIDGSFLAGPENPGEAKIGPVHAFHAQLSAECAHSAVQASATASSSLARRVGEEASIVNDDSGAAHGGLK